MKRKLLYTFVISIFLGSCTSDRKSEKKEKERIEQQIKEEKKSVEKEQTMEELKPQETQEESSVSLEKSSKKIKKSTDAKAGKVKEDKEDPSAIKIGVTEENKKEDGKVFTYKSGKGESIKVIFRTYDNNKNYIVIQRPGKPNIELDQEEAWAKGAIYQRDTIRMDFDFEKATLKIGDQSIEYVGNKEISN